jgi:hypothetical protein
VATVTGTREVPELEATSPFEDRYGNAGLSKTASGDRTAEAAADDDGFVAILVQAGGYPGRSISSTR